MREKGWEKERLRLFKHYTRRKNKLLQVNKANLIQAKMFLAFTEFIATDTASKLTEKINNKGRNGEPAPYHRKGKTFGS